MHTMHNNCTASCAATRKQRQGFQQSAQLTHIFYKYFYRKKLTQNCSFARQIRALKESFEIAEFAVQIVKSQALYAFELHSYMCALLSLLCIKLRRIDRCHI